MPPIDLMCSRCGNVLLDGKRTLCIGTYYGRLLLVQADRALLQQKISTVTSSDQHSAVPIGDLSATAVHNSAPHAVDKGVQESLISSNELASALTASVHQEEVKIIWERSFPHPIRHLSFADHDGDGLNVSG